MRRRLQAPTQGPRVTEKLDNGDVLPKMTMTVTYTLTRHFWEAQIFTPSAPVYNVCKVLENGSFLQSGPHS